jgi:hypothetical protein
MSEEDAMTALYFMTVACFLLWVLPEIFDEALESWKSWFDGRKK